jgi:uncharacterized membrane protein (UPF0127 family)
MSRFIFVRNPNQPNLSPARVKYCDSFTCRLRGLMFRNRLAPDDGLLLVQGKRDSRLDTSIHMLFVPFDLTVAWINSDMRVVDKVLAKAWRPAYAPARPARYILEIHPDRWDDYQIGDKVEFQNA